MPRKNPLPKRELEICLRVRDFRKGVLKWTQATFARELGTDAYSIAALEHGRRPLRYDLAEKMFARFPLNPVWLATGAGKKSAQFHLRSAKEDGIPDRALFSEAFTLLKDGLERGIEFAAGADARFVEPEIEFGRDDPYVRLEILDSFSDRVAEWLTRIPDDSLNDFYSRMVRIGESFAQSFQADSEFVIAERERKLKVDRLWLAHRTVELNPKKPKHEHPKITTTDILGAFLGKSAKITTVRLQQKRKLRKSP